MTKSTKTPCSSRDFSTSISRSPPCRPWPSDRSSLRTISRTPRSSAPSSRTVSAGPSTARPTVKTLSSWRALAMQVWAQSLVLPMPTTPACYAPKPSSLRPAASASPSMKSPSTRHSLTRPASKSSALFSTKSYPTRSSSSAISLGAAFVSSASRYWAWCHSRKRSSTQILTRWRTKPAPAGFTSQPASAASGASSSAPCPPGGPSNT